ncbi:MAG TPA: ABC transporter ATP-binding protein [Candidatus Limnocylindria bacterium]|jgi:ABC-2 type transport system ATP-binding protein|nr:ABC transporter ATP-binding protein [Candidatus Limnocylindria bacterium]
MPAVLETKALTKRFGRTVALRGCDVALPGGKVTGLVGPNGAGKTTLLQLAVGLGAPTSGAVSVLGLSPIGDTTALLARVGYVAQDRPLYRDLSVEETLALGRRLNVRWDQAYARARLVRFRIPPDRPIHSLSTGQHAQVALSLALGKRPELLLLDEPVANLDPVARLELLEELMSAVARDGLTVILTSNILGDVERICEHVAILVDGCIRVAGDIDELERGHYVVNGPRRGTAETPGAEVVEIREAERQTVALIRGAIPSAADDDSTITRPATLEEVVLGYLRSAAREVR